MRSSVATMTAPRSRCLVTVRTYAERERFMQRRQQLEQQHAAQVSAGLALSAARERGLRVERDRQDAQEAEREVTRLVRRNGPRHPPPPPPPPQPEPQVQADVEDKGSVPPAAAAAAVTAIATATPSAPLRPSASVPNGVASNGPSGGASSAASAFHVKLRPVHARSGASPPPMPPPPPRSPTPSPAAPPPPPPHCPTPDYDSDSSAASAARSQSKPTKVLLNGAEVEMQSLDSMELLEPRAQEPRPPRTYFPQQGNKDPARPSVCVTIREYGCSNNSRQPSKFSFLNNSRQSTAVDTFQKQQQEPAACRLQSELATTLSRSNIRNRFENGALENGCVTLEAKEPPKPEDVARGSITFTSVNGTSVPVSGKGNLPNGILKKVAVGHLASNGIPVGHGVTPATLAGAALNKTKTAGLPPKTITFGAKATIINEKSVPS